LSKILASNKEIELLFYDNDKNINLLKVRNKQ